MDCFYRLYIATGGVNGAMPEARRAALLRAHAPHHRACKPMRPGPGQLDALRNLFTFPDSADAGARREPGSPRVCRVCGVVSCAKAECFRSILTAEENLVFRQRLARHATAAERDAAERQNGHASR